MKKALIIFILLFVLIPNKVNAQFSLKQDLKFFFGENHFSPEMTTELIYKHSKYFKFFYFQKQLKKKFGQKH